MAAVSVCICTYKRPDYLRRLLDELSRQLVPDGLEYSIVVIDNDKDQSALPVIREFQDRSEFSLAHGLVETPNIALARNAAVRLAVGDFVAFIDDDEFPSANWLRELYVSLVNFQADAALGPVIPVFESPPPSWLIKSRLCDRKRFPTGTPIAWNETRTGNVMLRRQVFDAGRVWFDADFGALGGEDIDFFRRAADRGFRFVWNNEALVYEAVPRERQNISYQLRRAYLRGYISFHYYQREMTVGLRIKIFLKSAAAFVTYLSILPFLALSGIHNFRKFMVKGTDHLSRALTAIGLNKIRQRQI